MHDRPTPSRSRHGIGWMPSVRRSSTATPSPWPTTSVAAGRGIGADVEPKDYVVEANCKADSAARWAADRSGPRRRTGRGCMFAVAGEPARARRPRGNEYFLKHLLGTHSSVRAERGRSGKSVAKPTGRGLARRGPRGQARPAGVAGLPDDQFDPACTATSSCRRRPGTRSTTCQLQRTCTPSCTRCHPGDRPAVGDRAASGTSTRASPRSSARRYQRPGRDLGWACAATWSLTPLHARHPGGDRLSRAGGCWTGGAVRWRPDPGARRCTERRTIVERDYGAIADKLTSLGPLVR